jgi:Skp family chaperone for outer membrane proteins
MFTSKTPRWTLSRLAPIAVGAAALGALLIAHPARSADPATSAPVSIAIANPETIAEQIKEFKDLNGQLDLDQKSFAQTVQDKKNSLQAMQQALQFLKPDSPEFAAKQDDLLNASIAADAWAKETQLAFERKQKNKIRDLFQEIQDAIAKVAQKDGYSLVIADQRPKIPEDLDNPNITVDQLKASIAARTVLYSDQSRDISGEVITLMDKEYANKTAPH